MSADIAVQTEPSTTVEVQEAIYKLQDRMKARPGQRKRDLEKIKDSGIHLINISITTRVTTTFKLDWEDMNLPESVIARLTAMNAGAIPIPTFEGVKQAYSELDKKRREIRRKANMVYFDPTWFVTDEDLPQMVDLIDSAETLIPELQERMRISYPGAKRDCKKNLARLIGAAWPMPTGREARLVRNQTVREIVEDKMGWFPSLEDCLEGLSIRLDYLGRLPSIKEQMQADQELRELQTREMEDEQRREALVIQKRLELQTMRSRRDMIARVQKEAQDQIYRTIAEAIGMVEQDLARVHVHKKTRGKIEKELAKLDSALILIQETDNLSDLAGMADEITDICDRNKRGDQALSDRIASLKEWLKPHIEQNSDNPDLLELALSGML